MQKLRMCLIGFGLFLTAVLSMNSTFYAENIDLNARLKNKLKKYEGKISQDLFGNKKYTIKSVKFKGSFDIDIKLNNDKLPDKVLITATQESINNGTSNITKTFNFSETEEESFEITNSKTITTGGSVTVSAEIPFTSVGIESSFHLDVETSKSMTKGNMKSHIWTDTTEYIVKPGIKATAQFIISGSNAARVPYTGHIKVLGPVEVEMAIPRKDAGIVYLYEDAHYKGFKTWFHAGDNVSLSKDRKPGHPSNDTISSIKIEGPLSITVYEHVNYKGKKKTYTKSTGWVGDSWNDIISSFKVGCVKTKTIVLESYLSEGERSINIDGTLKADQGVKSTVNITEKPASGDAVSIHKTLRGKNAKVIPGGKIISEKIRAGARKR